MNNKNVISLTPFQKDIVNQILHDVLEEKISGAKITDITDEVNDITNRIDQALIMSVGLKQARENKFWSRVEDIKKRVTLTIKEV